MIVDHRTYAQTHKPRWKVIYACFCIMLYIGLSMKRASSWDYGTSRTCNQRRLRRVCTSAQSCQGHKCSHTRNVDEGACLKSGLLYSPTTTATIACFQIRKKWSKKPLVYRPCIFKFATSLFYPIPRGTFLYANNKGADQPAHQHNSANYL